MEGPPSLRLLLSGLALLFLFGDARGCMLRACTRAAAIATRYSSIIRLGVRLGLPPNPSIHFLPMDPVLQMHLEVIHARLWAWCIQFPGAIQAFDPRVIHEFDVWWGLPVGGVVLFHGDR